MKNRDLDPYRIIAAAEKEGMDGPEYGLKDTIAQIDEWMGNEDLNSPANLIELFQAASWWLKQLGYEKTYSGPGSGEFWGRVSALPRPAKGELYSCGVLLQEMESRIIDWLKASEKGYKKNFNDDEPDSDACRAETKARRKAARELEHKLARYDKE
jgi:hypothetical protein